MRGRRILYVALGAATALGEAAADSRGPAILKMGYGARSEALGRAYAGVADDASALFWNPAGLARLRRSELLIQHSLAEGGDAHDVLALARPVWWRGARRTWGASVSLLHTAPFDVMEEGVSLGEASPTESVVGFSYAQALGPWHAGGTAKWVRQSTFGRRRQTAAWDLGLAGEGARGRFRYGGGVYNLGRGVRSEDGRSPLPTIVRWGAGYAWTPARPARRLELAAQFDAPSGAPSSLRIGTEFSTSVPGGGRAALRLGARPVGAGSDEEGRWVGGVGWARGNLGVNYAFQPRRSLGSAHRVDMVLSLGREAPQEVQRRDGLQRVRALVEEGKWVAAREALSGLSASVTRDGEIRRLAREVNRRLEESLDPEVLYVLADQAFQVGNDAAAADFARKLLAVKPTHVDASRLLALAESRQEASRMTAVRREVARRRRGESVRQAREASAAEVRGDWERAFQSWQRAWASEPTEAVIAGRARARDRLYDEALRSAEAGRIGEAERWLGLIAEVTPGFRDVDRRRAALKEANIAQRRARAVQAYNDGLRAYAEGRQEAARRLFEEAFQLDPEDKNIRRAFERAREDR